jgi:hypothetical protein
MARAKHTTHAWLIFDVRQKMALPKSQPTQMPQGCRGISREKTPAAEDSRPARLPPEHSRLRLGGCCGPSGLRRLEPKVEHPIAKAKWVDSRKVWRLFWMRADLKWHSYMPFPETSAIAAVLSEVVRDPYRCFLADLHAREQNANQALGHHACI